MKYVNWFIFNCLQRYKKYKALVDHWHWPIIEFDRNYGSTAILVQVSVFNAQSPARSMVNPMSIMWRVNTFIKLHIMETISRNVIFILRFWRCGKCLNMAEPVEIYQIAFTWRVNTQIILDQGPTLWVMLGTVHENWQRCWLRIYVFTRTTNI